ncbi:MAG: bifunctional diaminohydroxyphosphoribosylaminopyrimidine deaminase/5-amino-6-(5-phosphoribosylamino)uracil reductase RibD [Flavobacteriaceae bacterium]|nr:bifunctional diaminohydroxyphosphoribosylaminopyrimidine deaminase/5-amino-6-(5-phosphoribosylamino)uracil reductase RibD [Flavobacteriaceae bacterium]
MVNIHEKFINRAVQIAKNGQEFSIPNPSVGCVITHQDTIIGEGFSSEAGGFHAEVNAIRSVKNQSLLPFSNLYVTLEPCSHFGKTPPCANLIIEKNIPNVFIGTLDPNPLVAGNGVKLLREAGIQVQIGILEGKVKEHHKRFLCFHSNKRPFIFLKWAQSVDGFLAPRPEKRNHQAPVWLSNPYSRQHTHKMRATEQSIMVGTNTAWSDNPSLTTREWSGNNPVRVLIDKNCKVSPNANALNSMSKSIVFNHIVEKKTINIHYKKIDFDANIILQILDHLHHIQIQSLIVEGGAITLQYFLEQNLWDEAWIYESLEYLKQGIKAPKIQNTPQQTISIQNNQLHIYKND